MTNLQMTLLVFVSTLVNICIAVHATPNNNDLPTTLTKRREVILELWDHAGCSGRSDGQVFADETTIDNGCYVVNGGFKYFTPRVPGRVYNGVNCRFGGSQPVNVCKRFDNGAAVTGFRAG